MVGRTLSHYRVVEPLGAGGMGEVYRAHDEKLDRDVALKVLPEGSLSDPEARKRFQREANALSRLSHPHIATIHDFDTADGVDFLVMELVKGPSLKDEIEDEGALPEKTVVRLGAQLARGLQAAHEQGIVHRDLKPGNLQLTPDGLLKILDFGLARLLPKEAPGDETAPTQTAVGRVAGTLLYMSPEQLRGRGVDARTDLYAAGAVLYEMATGRRLFTKASSAELTEAILNEDPRPPRDLQESITPGLEAVILKALDKDPELRYQTAKDLVVDLERLQLRSGSRPSGPESVASPLEVGRNRPHRVRWLVALATLTAVLAGGVWILRPPAPPQVTEVRRLHIDVGPDYLGGVFPMWATDGVRVYYTVRKANGFQGLFQAALGGGEPAEIATPFKIIEIHGFLHRQSALVVLAQGELPAPGDALGLPVWLVPLPQGVPRRLGGLRAQWVAVSPDQEQLALLTDRRLLLARSDGSDVEELMDLPEGMRGGWLRWSPDGGRLRFAGSGPGHGDESWIWEVSLEGTDPRPLWPGERGAWTADGRYFLIDYGNASVSRTDIQAVREGSWLPWVRKRPVQLTFGPVSFTYAGSGPTGNALLAYGRDPRGEAHRFNRRTGRLEPLLRGESVEAVAWSDEGQWLAWVTFPEGTLWRGRPDGSERAQLTSPPERAYWPAWSPDGTRIAFLGRGPEARGWSVRVVSSEGGGVETLKEAAGSASYWDLSWLPDGQSLLFGEKGYAHPGIYQVDLASRRVGLLDGAEALLYPKVGGQGQVLATLRRAEEDEPLSFQLYRPELGTWERLGPASLGFASWTRDGKAFCGLSSTMARIECHSLAAGDLETVADLGETPVLVGTTRQPWFALDADDNPLIILDRSTRDLYALDWEAP